MSSGQVETRLTFAETLNRTMITLLIVFTGVFLLQLLVPPFAEFAYKYLAINTADFISKLRLWQAATAIFLHNGLPHFLSNMLFFWFFGSAIANAWRKSEFLTFFFVCGIAGSVCYYFFQCIRGCDGVALGSSGAIFGLMAAYAMVYGGRIILAFFLIPMKARYFVMICMAIELLSLYLTTRDGIGHIAHLGGAAAGCLYIKISWRRSARPRKMQNQKSLISSIEVMEHSDEQ